MLQGSLENFALDEVLGLLAGTSKTGQLEIAGNRGTGTLKFNDGRLVDGMVSYTANGTGLEDVMFELLRYDEGTFTFSSGEVGPVDHAENVATVLASAENRLRDWRSIEAVVPTLTHQVAPADELPADEVTITRAEWAALTVIASGCPVSLVCDMLELGEVEGSRQIKNLAERELISVTEPLGGYHAASRSGSFAAKAGQEPVPTVAGTTAVTTLAASAATSGTVTPVAGNGTVTSAAGAAGNGTVFPPAPDGTAASPAPDATEPAPTNGTSVTDPAPSTTDAGNTQGMLTGERPPMPPPPLVGEVAPTEDGTPVAPPAPPSPSEISSFSDELQDLSELVDDTPSPKSGGLLARYLKSDD